MARILADLPDDDIKWLDAKAAEQGGSRASVVREAVSSYGAEVAASTKMDWLKLLSKCSQPQLADMEAFMSGFGMDEVDAEIAHSAAALRRDRPRFKSTDAIILASAQVRGRILVARNTNDFPANMPGIRVPYEL